MVHCARSFRLGLTLILGFPLFLASAASEASSLRIGPIPGLTTAWHVAPETMSIPLGSTLSFKRQVPAGASLVWTGATEVAVEGGWSFAECSLNQVGTYTVRVRVLLPNGAELEESAVLDVVAITVEQVSVSPIRVLVNPIELDASDLNASTQHYFFGLSIAELREVSNNWYRTSTNRPVRLSVDVEPAGFAALMEWRIAGRPLRLGSVRQVTHPVPARQWIEVGPTADPRAVFLETYRVEITSHVSDADVVPQGVPVTFTAATEPAGHEDEITWLASTKYGSSDPVMGSGPEFTVRFDDTWAAHPLQDEPFQWLGVKADGAVFNQDQKLPAGELCFYRLSCLNGDEPISGAGLELGEVRWRSSCLDQSCPTTLTTRIPAPDEPLCARWDLEECRPAAAGDLEVPGTLAGCPAGEPGELAQLLIEASEPHVADGEDVLTVDVLAFDSQCQLVTGAEIEVTLVLGLDEAEQVDAVSLGEGRYRAELTSVVAGDAMIFARDRQTGASAKQMNIWLAGDPVEVTFTLGDPQEIDGELTRELVASVDDRFGNRTTEAFADVFFETDFGTVDEVEYLADGTFRSRVRASQPGTARVTAIDLESGLWAAREIAFPAVSLSCEGAVHLTGREDEDRTITVDVRLFTGRQSLRSYDLLLQHNELTSFQAVQPSTDPDALPPPSAQLEGSDRVRISQTLTSSDPSGGPAGYFEVATLLFACEGEGDSVIDVIEATLTPLGSASAAAANRPDDPLRESAICPNKRVKKICVQPIVVKGVAMLDSITEKVTDHLEEVQKNLDEGCCEIEIERKDTVEIDPPYSYTREAWANVDPDKPDEPQVIWDARSIGSSHPNKIILSAGMADLLCDANPRDDTCINVYVVEDDSMMGRFPPVRGPQQASRDQAKLAVVSTERFRGADIKRQRLNPEGDGCEELTILRPTDSGLEEIQESDCQVDAVVLGAGKSLDSFRTLKHEIGHMLGLRHPWEYTDERLEQIRESDQRPKGSVMYYRDDHLLYTRGECQLIMEHNCNQYQSCE